MKEYIKMGIGIAIGMALGRKAMDYIKSKVEVEVISTKKETKSE